MPAKSKKAPTTQMDTSRALPSKNTTKPANQAHTVAKKTQASGGQATSTNGSHTPTTTESAPKENDFVSGNPGAPSQVNRKKQKRREKEAAKRAVEQQLSNGYSGEHGSINGQSPYSAQGRGPPRGYFNEEPEYVHPDFADDGGDLDDHFYSGEDESGYPGDPVVNHEAWAQGQAGRKKRKDKDHNHSHNSTSLTRMPPGTSRSPLAHPPTLSNAAFRSAHRMSGESIWNTSTQAERENIKQFWLELGEEERRSLVKVEKEAVLRKMKEQQKHSCSCSVCGRKRTAIEEELEVLYDAYYEELEQFANHNNDLSNAPQLMAPPRAYRQLRGPAHPMAGSYPQRGRVHEIGEDDDGLDEDEEYDEDDEGYSDDDIDDLPPGAPDFFTFGNSLTVKDGILTVADDLLKNDGKHFIDMMEQLAERRMQREEEIHYPSPALAHQTVHQGHNHPPIDEDDDYDDDEDDEDYDSQEEDDYEGDEMVSRLTTKEDATKREQDSMTEEQRMEEGRRMFQIFAARMFEQRVLTAYREKVARERQQKLLEELDEESRLDTQREAKKAKEAAKKKEKKRLQKLAKDEEKAKKDAEKSAQEAAAKEVEERRLEEQRQRKEEQRKKREAEKKAAEEERLRKEAEKQRRAQEEREKQAEIERKQKEGREKEKKKRDEARKREREEREAKEKEVRDRKAKEDEERKAKEDQLRKGNAAVAKAERDPKGRQEQATRRQPVALPPGLYPPSHSSHLQSPHFQVVTPIMPPKVPTPNRNRQTSQPGQQSHGSSPRSQQANTDNSRSSGSPATIAVPQTPGMSNVQAKAQGQPPPLHHPQPSAPLSPLSSQGRGQQHFMMNGIPGVGMNGPPVSGPGMMSGMGPQMPMYQGPPMGGQQRFGPPQGMSYPPGFSGPRHFSNNQPLPFHNHSQGAMPIPIPAPQNHMSKGPSHSRQQSDSNPDSSAQPAPIARPNPIGRPSSTTPDRQKSKRKSPDFDVDQLTTQLGSKALLDDSDLPLSSEPESKVILQPLGPPGSGRAPFSNSFGDQKHETPFGLPGQSWSGFSPSMSSTGSWGAPGSAPRAGGAWPQANNNAFGAIGGGMPSMARPHASRPVAIRLMLVQACKQLSTGPGVDNFIPVQNVLRQLDMLKSPNEPPISMDEVLAICDTEGNPQNGGGSFDVRHDGGRGQVVKFEPDAGTAGRSGAGDIGSPISSYGQPVFGGLGQGFGPPGRAF